MVSHDDEPIRQVSRRQFLTTVLLPTAALALAACEGQGTPTPAKSSGATAVPAPAQPTVPPKADTDLGLIKAPEPNPKRGGTIRFGILAATPHYDLHQSGVQNTGFCHMYNCLVRPWVIGDENIIIPDLAKRWDISPDGKQYTFYLREGVRFHDGTPFTSADVVATFNRIINPPSGVVTTGKALYSSIDAIEATSPTTVRFTLKQPFFLFLELLGGEATGAIYSKKTLDANGGDLRKVIAPGTGPYRLKEEKPGEYWLLERNPDFWIPGLPYVDFVQTINMPTADDRGTAILTDRCDWTTVAGVKSWEEGKKRPDIVTVTDRIVNLTRTGFRFNCTRKPFDDPRVRRALLLARNIDDLWIKVFGQYEITNLSRWVLRGDPHALSDDEVKKLPGWRTDKTQDLAEAKKLLAEAGYADGIKNVDMICISGHTTYYPAVALQDYLKRTLNIEVKLRAMERNIWAEDDAKGNFDMSCAFWAAPSGSTDFGSYASVYFRSGSPSNSGGYRNPQLDAMLDQYLGELDFAKRKALMRRIEDSLDQDPPWLINGTVSLSTMWRNSVKGMMLDKRNSILGRSMDTAWLDR